MASDEEEDDYLTMTFDEPSTTRKETSLQRTARLKKEAAERGRIPSKAEKEAAAAAAREKALATELDSSSKGAKMMAKMGFKAGGGLGAAGNEGRIRPIELGMKDDKGGIGADSEKKRKIREAAAQADEGVKRTKISEEEFRERNVKEREEKRVEGLWLGAMKILEGFEEDGDVDQKDGIGPGGKGHSTKRLMKSVNILYRPLVKERLEKERDRRARYDLTQSLSRNEEYTEEDAHDKLALGDEVQELDEEDSELEEYQGLPATEKLDNVVKHLREKYWYCFWCKYRYEDEGMEDCPGLTEDEHG
ncbi:hypothetical protein WHR41_05055 [Cladosporium halotolerans]|uniref:G-patch domain-containing protein n=1 Tax=Cladosporium halotolerans TaxID=1052096 RepID=A0AB34KP12_9PEZI